MDVTEHYWTAGTGVPQLDELVDEHVRESIKHLFDSSPGVAPLIASIPLIWWPVDGGFDDLEPPSELIVRVEAEGSRDWVRNFNLGEEIRAELQACRQDGSFRQGLARLAVVMRELADEITAVTGAPGPPDPGG